MHVVFLAFALQAGLVGSPAPARAAASTVIGPVTGNAATVSKVKLSKGDESICRYEQATGSRITTRECHTRDQWVQMDNSAKDYMDKILHPQGCGPGTTC